MILIDELFVWENVENLEMVVYGLKRNIPMPPLYCIVYRRKKNRMEIWSSIELFSQRIVKAQNTEDCIVGIAYGKMEGIQLLSYIVEQALIENKEIQNPRQWF